MPGIEVEAQGLFAGVRGRQIAGRFTLISAAPFAYGTTEQRDAWRSLVATLEAMLRLHRHQPGTLVGLADYLYQRTGGMIGSLSHLDPRRRDPRHRRRQRADHRNLLDDVPVDHAAARTTPATPTRAHAVDRGECLMAFPPADQRRGRRTTRSPSPTSNRLATLHEMPFAELWPQVSRPRRNGQPTRRLDADLLAAVADQPASALARAVIELRAPEPDWLALRHEPQRGCWRCNARHPGGPVLQLLGHHRYACTRHRVWIGPPDLTDHPQPDLTPLPEIVAAQHVHLRLLRRLGPAATFDAVLTGFLICAHRWNSRHDPTPTDARHHWARRAQTCSSRPAPRPSPSAPPRLFAATYPEAVSIAELIGSLHWRRLAAGDPDDQRRFATEIGRRLGQPDYRPGIINDPIAHWIDQDCWRPPSLPSNDYRSLRTFGGRQLPQAALRTATETRFTSAHWFGVHRRGGDAMLHHRTLAPSHPPRLVCTPHAVRKRDRRHRQRQQGHVVETRPPAWHHAQHVHATRAGPIGLPGHRDRTGGLATTSTTTVELQPAALVTQRTTVLRP